MACSNAGSSLNVIISAPPYYNTVIQNASDVNVFLHISPVWAPHHGKSCLRKHAPGLLGFFLLGLFDGVADKGRVAVETMDKFAIGHRDEKAANDTKMDDQQTAHGWRLPKQEQQ